MALQERWSWSIFYRKHLNLQQAFFENVHLVTRDQRWEGFHVAKDWGFRLIICLWSILFFLTQKVIIHIFASYIPHGNPLRHLAIWKNSTHSSFCKQNNCHHHCPSTVYLFIWIQYMIFSKFCSFWSLELVWGTTATVFIKFSCKIEVNSYSIGACFMNLLMWFFVLNLCWHHQNSERSYESSGARWNWPGTFSERLVQKCLKKCFFLPLKNVILQAHDLIAIEFHLWITA